ncbi:MAG: hypothetical protein WCC47_00395, partial [Pseudonocardiaceae bacterium]
MTSPDAGAAPGPEAGVGTGPEAGVGAGPEAGVGVVKNRNDARTRSGAATGTGGGVAAAVWAALASVRDPELNFIIEHVGLPRIEDFCFMATQEPNV